MPTHFKNGSKCVEAVLRAPDLGTWPNDKIASCKLKLRVSCMMPVGFSLIGISSFIGLCHKPVEMFPDIRLIM